MIKTYFFSYNFRKVQNNKRSVILWLKFGNVPWNMGKGCWELWKGKLITMHYRQYGTSLSISANGLKILFAALLEILKHQLEMFQQPNT